MHLHHLPKKLSLGSYISVARKSLSHEENSKPESTTQIHTYKHFHLDITASIEIRSLLRTPVLSISLMGWGGTKAALVHDESLYLLLCFALLAPQPRDLQPLLCPLPLSAPVLFFFLIFSDHLLPASNHSPNATRTPPPYSF